MPARTSSASFCSSSSAPMTQSRAGILRRARPHFMLARHHIESRPRFRPAPATMPLARRTSAVTPVLISRRFQNLSHLFLAYKFGMVSRPQLVKTRHLRDDGRDDRDGDGRGRSRIHTRDRGHGGHGRGPSWSWSW